MPRVLMITGPFAPDASVGVLRSAKFCKYLPAFGWMPEVLAYEPRPELEMIDPGTLRELPPELRVHRTHFVDPLSIPFRIKQWFRHRRMKQDQPAESAARQSEVNAGHVGPHTWRSLIRTLLLNSPDRLISWLPTAVAAGYRPARRARCIYSSAPPYTPHLAALALHRITGRPLVLDFRDPWGDDHRPDLAGPRHKALHCLLEGFCIRRASFVIHATEDAREAMMARYPDEPAEKFVTIYNGFDEQEMPEEEGRLARSDPTQPLEMSYFGNFYGTRVAVPLINAMVKLLHDDGIDSRRLVLKIYGNITNRTRQRLTELNFWESVQVIPRLSREAALRAMCDSALLVLVGSADMDRYCIATKLYEYLATGRPILAVATPGPITRLLEGCKVGHVASPTDTPGLAELLKRLLAQHENGGLPAERAVNLTQFTRKYQAGQLAKLLTQASEPGFHRQRHRKFDGRSHINRDAPIDDGHRWNHLRIDAPETLHAEAAPIDRADIEASPPHSSPERR